MKAATDTRQVVGQPTLAVRMVLRATKRDENRQRPDGIRPQDAILPHKLCRRPVVFDRADLLSGRSSRLKAGCGHDCPPHIEVAR
jgi:hypothetical protein